MASRRRGGGGRKKKKKIKDFKQTIKIQANSGISSTFKKKSCHS